MKRNLSDFIRGSQLFQHDAQMFYVGLKWPVIALGIAFCWMTWWQASDALSDHQVYLIWMKFYAHGWALIGLDPGKDVTLESGLGGTFTIPVSHVVDFPPVVTAWATFLDAVRHAALIVFGVGLPLLAAFYWAAVWLGRKAKETRHQRGARLVTTRQLLSQIRKQNRIRQGAELEPTMGKRWILATRRELDALGFYRPIELAGMPYPWREEQTHAMLIGSTGTGKTVAIMDLIDQIRARGQRAIVFDLTGAFISTFYDPERDTILHPLDTRCPA